VKLAGLVVVAFVLGFILRDADAWLIAWVCVAVFLVGAVDRWYSDRNGRS
jgi:hypothetical protein